jgi:putative SOS response-associated peptidase YedK
MCGRFNVIDNPGLRVLLCDLGIDVQLPQAVNVAPTEQASLIRSVNGASEIVSARWWLTPSWAKQVDQKYAMFNARSESLSTRSAYKKPFKRQRGVIAMSSFIEWRTHQGVKQPYRVSSDSGAMSVAALWDVWRGEETPLLSCTMVTTAAAPAFSPWHARMPVLLSKEECGLWLNNDTVIADNDPIFRSELKEGWQLAPLGPGIGNARNKGVNLLVPVGEVVSLGD